LPKTVEIDREEQLQVEHGSALEVFRAFLHLGCTSFGGPAAHLGYFRKEFVDRRQWCSEETLAELIAIAQALPGPSSSQVGFALGILRAGWLGGIAAWIGFTAPSALLMLLFASGISLLNRSFSIGLIHGLQLVAVAVVAQAVLGMQRTLAPDRARILLAILATGLTLMLPAQIATAASILIGAFFGIFFLNDREPTVQESALLPRSKVIGFTAAIAFLLLLALSFLNSGRDSHPAGAVFAALYRCGALVFGGGHVVLPLLEDAIVTKGWIPQQNFLAGYGAAQALPGPLFSIGAFLGAEVKSGSYAWLYGFIGLIAIFLPGLLAITALLPLWSSLRTNRRFSAMLRGMNASVVGVLIAALFHPLWTSTIHSSVDFWIALVEFSCLMLWNARPWIVVLGVSAVAIVLQAVSS
jgi:chromate transporter